MKRPLILLLALLLVAGIAFAGRQADPRLAAMKMCTPKPSKFDYGTMIASDLGSIVPALNKPLPYDKMAQTIRGAWWTVGYWAGVFGAAVQGRPTTVPAPEPVDCGALLDPCTSTTPPPPAAGGQPPFNPKDLALGGGNPAVNQGLGGNATGPDMGIVRTAIEVGQAKGIPQRGWVVIVAAGLVESGVRNLNYGDRDSVGWLQQRGGWGPVSERMDPRIAAEKFYDHLKNVRGWQSMSINDAAQAVQISGTPTAYGLREAEAKRLVASIAPTSNTTASSVPLDPMVAAIDQPQCDPTATLSLSGAQGGGPGTVGVWNIHYRNSSANITRGAGFADLVCLNELRSQRVQVPGYQVTPYSSAVEIIWKTSALDKLEVHRNTTLTGYARDKSAVWGVWRNKATGRQFGAICTHQLVQGGTGWAKQAYRVNQIRIELARRGIPVLVLGDMNRTAPGVHASFGGFQDCVRIICAVGHGIKSDKVETLSKMGSDHPRVRYTYSAIAPPPALKNAPPTTGTGTASIGGGQAPSRSGVAGIREVAARHHAEYISPHSDPQGLPSFDIGSSGAKNSAIAEDMRTNHEALGLEYVISQMRIASARSNWNWRPYSPITSAGDFRHVGHVHVTY